MQTVISSRISVMLQELRQQGLSHGSWRHGSPRSIAPRRPGSFSTFGGVFLRNETRPQNIVLLTRLARSLRRVWPILSALPGANRIGNHVGHRSIVGEAQCQLDAGIQLGIAAEHRLDARVGRER